MLTGQTIAVTAERRAHQQVQYLIRRGATVRHVPVLRTVDGADTDQLRVATTQIATEGIDVLVIQTGQGLDWWLDGVASSQRARLDSVLAGAQVFTRGAKATSAARRRGLNVMWQSAEESVTDVVDHLRSLHLDGLRCGLLAHGNEDRRVTQAALDRGATVIELDIYRYAAPDDVDGIIALIDDIVGGKIDVVTFTASPAIRHLRTIADDHGRLRALDVAFATICRPAVVGPVCAATAAEAAWAQMIEPESARLIPMLDAVVDALVAPTHG